MTLVKGFSVMYTRNNRVSPLVDPRIYNGENTSLNEGNMRRLPFKGILKECDHRSGADMRYEQMNEAAQVRQTSNNEHKKCFQIDCVYPSNTLQKSKIVPGNSHCTINTGDAGGFEPYSGLIGASSIQFPSTCASVLHGNLNRKPHTHSSVSNQEGDLWCPRYLPNQTRAVFTQSQRKTTLVPSCPLCHQPTIQVFPDNHGDTSISQERRGESVSEPSIEDPQPSLTKATRPAATTPLVNDCAEYLKCFACLLPSMEERSVCKHCYVLSVICWLAVILTIIIVIIATVSHKQ